MVKIPKHKTKKYCKKFSKDFKDGNLQGSDLGKIMYVRLYFGGLQNHCRW